MASISADQQDVEAIPTEISVTHPLKNQWVLWFDNPDQRLKLKDWGNSMKEVCFSFSRIKPLCNQRTCCSAGPQCQLICHACTLAQPYCLRSRFIAAWSIQASCVGNLRSCRLTGSLMSILSLSDSCACSFQLAVSFTFVLVKLLFLCTQRAAALKCCHALRKLFLSN